MKLKTFAILLSLSAACSSTTYAMNSDQDPIKLSQKLRQDSLKKVEEIQAAQEKLRQDSKRRMEEIQEADRKSTAANV